MLSRILAAALAASTIGTALAAPPNVSFNPAQDADGTPDGGSGSPSFEIVFTGPTKSVTITPSGGSGVGLPNQTTLLCSVSGDPEIEKTLGPPPTFEGATATPQDIELTCVGAAVSKTSVMTCLEKKGAGPTVTYRWDVSCPVAGVAEYTSSPPAGNTLAVASTQPADGSVTLSVTNIGGAPLTVSSITGLMPPLSVTPGFASIGSSLAQVFTIACDGAAPGTFSQDFTINTNDADEAAVGYGVDCTVAVPPSAEFSATVAPGASLPGLAGVQGGATPITTVTITNVGNAELILGAITGIAAPLSAGFGAPTLAPSASTNLTVSCDTTGQGGFGPQTLAFTTNDPDDGEGAIGYAVSCTIVPPTSAEFSPSLAPPGPVDLANTAGAPAVTSVVTITNIGDADLTLGGLSPLSPPLGVSLSSTSISAAGGTATLTISCAGVGPANTNQSLTFTTNDPDEGEGAIGYSLSCAISAAPAPEFAATPVAPGPLTIATAQGANGTTSVTVHNVGNAALALNVATPPAAPISLSAVPAALAAGASTLLTVTCDAASAGSFSRSFTLGSNDSDESGVGFNVDCTVNAPLAPDATATPAAPGPVGITTFQGTNGQNELSFKNDGGTPLQILSVSGLVAPFGSTGTPVTIAPTEKASVTITCDATSLGLFNDTFAVTTNDPDEGTLNFDATCRVQPDAPEFDSSPGAGSGLTINTFENEIGAQFLFLSNLGARPMNVSISPLPPPLSVSFLATTIDPGFGATLAIACAPTTAGSFFAMLQVAHNDTGESPASYPVSCFAAPDQRGAFRVLLHGGVFTSRRTELLLRNGFE